MELAEGDILEGTIGVSGGAGPDGRWIVVAPDGRTHLHSLDAGPLHCWPLHSAVKGLEQGTLRRIGSDPQHPVVRLQRAKERKGIHDIHLGLSEEALARMLELLAEAVAGGEDYAPNAAAEIDAFIDRGLFDPDRRRAVRAQVEALLTGRRPGG